VGAKGVVSMVLTVGSKMLAMTFFIPKTQGNFSLILSRDWIHANHAFYFASILNLMGRRRSRGCS
jgi:hypothetical protein